MLDISWQEIMVIAAVAIIFIGPKDLPGAIRTVAQWLRKAREMAGEFQRGVDEMVREAELADVRKQVEQVATGLTDDVKKSMDEVKSSIDPTGELEKSIQPPEFFNDPVKFEPQGPPAPVESAPLEATSGAVDPLPTAPSVEDLAPSVAPSQTAGSPAVEPPKPTGA
jgi:sec-independent protein translocase protein TatB